MSRRLAVFASGTGTNFSAIVDHVRAGSLHADVVLLVCDRPGAPVVERARGAGVPVLELAPRRFASKADYEQTVLDRLRLYRVDVVVLAGYMRIVTPLLMAAYPNRILNIHPAYLPEFPGKQGILDAFHAGVAQTGVTVHLIDEGVDSGPILRQVRVPRYPEDTLDTLEARIHGVEHELYPAVIESFLNAIESDGQ